MASPAKPSGAIGKLKLLAGLGAAGYVGHKALQQGAAQEGMVEGLQNSRREDLSSPLPSISVLASYDAFASEKLAGPLPTAGVLPHVSTQASFALANTLANKLVGDPIDAVHGLLKKKLYEDPKHRQAFESAVKSPDVARSMAEDPEAVHGAFRTLKRFGPSLAQDPNVVRSFLRQTMMAGGQVDYATIRSLAETEKFIQAAKGKGTPT